jgi:hypothetical protein
LGQTANFEAFKTAQGSLDFSNILNGSFMEKPFGRETTVPAESGRDISQREGQKLANKIDFSTVAVGNGKADAAGSTENENIFANINSSIALPTINNTNANWAKGA